MRKAQAQSQGDMRLCEGSGGWYTGSMLKIMLLLMGLAQASAGDAAFYGAIPKDVPTFKVYDRGSPLGYGALLVDQNTFWRETTVQLPPGRRPSIVWDTPWAPSTLDRAPSGATYEYESAILRKTRLEREWAKAGYEFIQTPSGTIPVLRREREYAARAREMAAAQETDAMTEVTSVTVEDLAVRPKPSFLALWGGHLAVFVVGVFLIIVVVKTMILGDGGGWQKVG